MGDRPRLASRKKGEGDSLLQCLYVGNKVGHCLIWEGAEGGWHEGFSGHATLGVDIRVGNELSCSTLLSDGHSGLSRVCAIAFDGLSIFLHDVVEAVCSLDGFIGIDDGGEEVLKVTVGGTIERWGDVLAFSIRLVAGEAHVEERFTGCGVAFGF